MSSTIRPLAHPETATSPARVPALHKHRASLFARLAVCKFVRALIYGDRQIGGGGWGVGDRQKPVLCTASGLPADNDEIHSAMKNKKMLRASNKKAKREDTH